MCSTATAGRLLAGGAPLSLLKAGVIAHGGDRRRARAWATSSTSSSPASTRRRPAAGLPQLQLAAVGDVATDYGDYFVSGLVGAILAAERGPQLVAAAVMLPVAEAWNQLFLVVDSLPNTTAPALVLIGAEVWRRRGRRRVASEAVRMTPRLRIVGRRVVVVGVVGLQLGLVGRGLLVGPQAVRASRCSRSRAPGAPTSCGSPPTAGASRSSSHGRATAGRRWSRTSGCSTPSVRHHADAGLDNQLAFLRSALDWVADNTPRDHDTRYLEATVTSWHNDDPLRTEVFRSRFR